MIAVTLQKNGLKLIKRKMNNTHIEYLSFQELITKFGNHLSEKEFNQIKEKIAIEKGWFNAIWLNSERLGDDTINDAWYWYSPEGYTYSEEEIKNIKIEDL